MKRWNLIVAISCALCACSDDDDNGAAGRGGNAAVSGSGGRSSRAGRGGEESGGREGGGRGGQSGEDANDDGGRGGDAEQGGESGSSGAGEGGQSGGGGEDANSSGAGGAAGAAGAAGESGSGASGVSGASAGSSGAAGATTPAPRTCKAPTTNPPTTVNACPASNPGGFKPTLVTSGLGVPTFLAPAPGDATNSRLFVLDRAGSIRLIKDGVLQPTPFLTQGVSEGGSGERGLLGIVFDPQYQTNGRFFINYTGSAIDGTATSFLVSYKVSAANPDLADDSSRALVLSYPDLEENHNGGMMAFGPDGCMYIGTGDGGGGDDQHGNPGNGQDFTQPLGKILRIDPDYPTEAAPGNLALPTADPKIWDYGLRNPWRFSFDRLTGDLYIGDVGQGLWEEVDVEPKGVGNKNYGWRPMEGKHCRGNGDDTSPLPATCPDDAGDRNTSDFTLPVWDYGHFNGNNCVIGGYVYRGSKIPSLQSWYLFADNNTSKIWAFVWNGSALCKDPIELTAQLPVEGKITSFSEDNSGELYILTDVGNAYRIDPSTP